MNAGSALSPPQDYEFVAELNPLGVVEGKRLRTADRTRFQSVIDQGVGEVVVGDAVGREAVEIPHSDGGIAEICDSHQQWAIDRVTSRVFES